MNPELSSNTNNADEIEIDDAEAAKLVDLSAFGIDPMTTDFDKLRSTYRDQRNIVVRFVEAQKSGAKVGTDLRSIAEKNVIIGNVADLDLNPAMALVDTVRNTGEDIFALVDMAPETLGVLISKMEDVLAMLKNEKSFYVERELAKLKREQNIVMTEDESATQAKLVAQAIRSVIQLRAEMAKFTGAEVPADLFKVSETGRTELNEDRLPKMKTSSSAPAGRNAKLRFMEYVVSLKSGENYAFKAGETTLGEIAHDLLSKGTVRPTRASIEADLAKQGIKSQMSKDWWAVELPTGTVCGRMADEK